MLGRIEFRPLTRDDFGLLARWLAAPHVARWWVHEFTMEAIERDFGPAIDGAEPSDENVVLLDATPIGLLQHVRFADYPEYVAEMSPVYPVPEGAASIDYFIGEPAHVGHGVGTRMLSTFTQRIWATTPATCVVVPVNASNIASWRALERAGYRRAAQVELDPDNPVDDRLHEVMRIDRPPAIDDGA